MKKLTKCLSALALAAGIALCCLPGGMRADGGSADAPAADGGPVLHLTALNIGKADCLLLLWDGQAFLIDAGYRQNYPAIRAMLEQYGVARLNGVFLTHCHEDHYGGLAPLAQSDLPIDSWYAPALFSGVKASKHPAVLAAAARGQQVRFLSAGDVISAGADGQFAVLGPTVLNEDNENNNSLVLRFSCPSGSVLLAGDMKDDEEYDLLSAGAFQKSDVLKVGHHGDNKASTLNMLRAVQPKVSLILTSSQEESDTPARKTLARLSAVGSQIFVSQDAHDAWEVTLRGGVPQVRDVQWDGAPEKASGLSLRIDPDDDLITIFNRGEDSLSLSQFALYSTRGNELLLLPDVAVAGQGQFTVGSRATAGACDWRWSISRVWHQKKLDRAILYDDWGRLVAVTDNGKPE